MNHNLTDIVIVLDRSGSMADIRSDVEAGLNEFIRKQKLEPGFARVTFVKFDDVIETVFVRKCLKNVEHLTLEPRNCTALYEAVGTTINEVEQRLAEMPEKARPGKVIFVIVTDGLNNVNREFNRQKVFDMIRHQRENYKWQFVFIGADMDAYAASDSIGVLQGCTLSSVKTKRGVAATFDSLSKKMSDYRGMEYANYCCSVDNGTFFDANDVKLQQEAKANA